MRNHTIACVVTIAGTDPSGGAGIQADIKAISATGSYAASIITALVAQNTQGVQAIQEIPVSFIEQQIASVFSDLTVNAVKIGMLHDEKIIAAVATALSTIKPPHVVFDPVMVAKNGSVLLKLDTINFLKQCLFPHIHLITPNLFEAEQLLGEKIENTTAMASAAKKMADEFKLNVLLKGGHLTTQQSSDVLHIYRDNTQHWFHANRINTRNTHGTGCSLSSAIASFLAQDYALVDAISHAKQYLTDAIQSGSRLQIGRGCGPVDHFYQLRHKENSL